MQHVLPSTRMFACIARQKIGLPSTFIRHFFHARQAVRVLFGIVHVYALVNFRIPSFERGSSTVSVQETGAPSDIYC